MRTVTLKLEQRQVDLLSQRAKTLGRSQGAIVRELIDKHLDNTGRQSLLEQARDLCGSVRGPRDLSTRPLKGYGRD